MTRALIILFALAVAPCIASELDVGYPTPSEVAAEQLEDYDEDLEDFTDSGVGCTDDCLDPVEPFTDPATVQDEYILESD